MHQISSLELSIGLHSVPPLGHTERILSIQSILGDCRQDRTLPQEGTVAICSGLKLNIDKHYTTNNIGLQLRHNTSSLVWLRLADETPFCRQY